MKWINGLTREEKQRQRDLWWRQYMDEKSQWHNWFAWFPVVVGVTKDHHRIKAWWQLVQRRAVLFNGWYREVEDYEYREWQDDK